VLLPQIDDCYSCFSRFLGSFSCATKEESQPTFPVTSFPDGHQAVIILGPVALEEKAEVQQGPMKHIALY